MLVLLMLVLLTWWKRVRSGVPALTRPFSACRISTFFSNLNLVWSVENWKGRFSKIKIQEVEPCEILGRRRGLWSKACQADTWDNAELLICIMKIQEIVDFLKRSFSLWNQNTNFVQPTRAWLFGAVDIVGYIVAHHHVGANKRPCTNEDPTRYHSYLRIWGRIFDLLLVHTSNTLNKLDNSKLGSTQQWMTLTCCQDHILTENIWFVWSETSYNGDKMRCYNAGRTTTTNNWR